MTKHTPEPWVQDENRFGTPIVTGRKPDGCGEELICILSERYHSNIANAQRIVACVNACAGFSNEELETLGHFKAMHETIVAENKQLRKERIKMHSLLLQFISAFEGENEGREMTKQARLPEPKWVKEAKQITK